MQKQPPEEQLSALMDGELSAADLDQLLNEIEQRPALREQWSNHHRARHLLFEQGEPAPQSNQLADRVSATLAQQPTILAPGLPLREPSDATTLKPDIDEPAMDTPATVASARKIRPWIPMALAASLASVSFLLLQQQWQPSPYVVAGREAVAATEWVEVEGAWVERWINPLDRQERARSYLVRHDEQRTVARQRGSLVSTAPSLEGFAEPTAEVKRVVGWRLGWLPEGFREVETLRHQIPLSGGEVTHRILSNGDAVSLSSLSTPPRRGWMSARWMASGSR